MSEIYLTKVERKTIFTQGLIYVFLMFVISDFMVVGPLWFKLFPWLYLLGLIAKSRFAKPVLALVIASFTTFISAILKTEGLTLEVMIVTLNSIFMVTAGVITGTYIYDLKLSHRLVKFIPKAKKIYMLLVSLFITVIVVAVNAYINGNAYTYIKTRTSIAEYVSKQYNKEKYEITSVKYELINFIPQYMYTLKVDGEEIELRYTDNRKFEDINIDSRMQKSMDNLNKLIKDETNKILEKNKYVQAGNVEYKLEFSKTFLKPDKLNVYIQTEFDEKQKDIIYNEIILGVKEINAMVNISDYDKEYIVTCGNKVASIKQKNITNITIKYLEDSFTVDELSQI